jgi:rod shape determining protein RodA
VLILKQPDLGSACLFGVIFGALLIWAGVKKWILAGLFAAGSLAAAGVYPFLKPYQKERILTFIDPSRDPLDAGYQVIQSTVAIGSGGLLGQGWGQGTQAVHRYLPEAYTDFIFAATVEQTGLIGGLAILALYGVILWRMLATVHLARDRFGAFVAVGLGAIIVGHVGINIGMNVGLFPITGLPLPFLSYGGSFLVSMFVVIGLVLNVSMRRFVFARSN